MYHGKISNIIQKNPNFMVLFGLWCLHHIQQYFSYIVPVSFIGGGNQSTLKKKPRPVGKSLTNYQTFYYTINI